jgi:hypothetical protein
MTNLIKQIENGENVVIKAKEYNWNLNKLWQFNTTMLANLLFKSTQSDRVTKEQEIKFKAHNK